MPARYSTSIFFGPQENNLLQFEFSQAELSVSPVSKSAASYPYPGTTPSVSANGATNAIVWAIEHSDPNDVLHAYSATNLQEGTTQI